MRKFKRIVPFIAAVCLVFSLCFSLACKTDENVLQSLTLDTSNAKVDYSLGEEYRSTGLQVTANYSSGQTEAVSIENVTINSSAYDAYTLGSYDIIVSYSSEGATVEASYKVNVVEMLSGGLVVKIKDGRPSKLDLSANHKTESFTSVANWIEVRKPDQNGEVDMSSAALSKDSYTVSVYKNGKEVTDLGNINRGVYQIVASMYDAKEDYTYEGFTFIVVFDDVKSIEFTEGSTSQDKGLKETMTPTWKFTVTFNSGDTEVIDKTNPYLKLTKINPNVAEDGGTVTATYSEPAVLNLAPATSERNVLVHYSLTGKQSNPDLAILNFGDTSKFDASTTYTDQTVAYQYKADATTFNVVFGPKGKIAGDRKASFDLPTGINVNGATSIYCEQAWQSNGPSSATGMYIEFTLNKNCEIYVYARSNGTDDRCMFLETENDYAVIDSIEGYVGDKPILGISGVPTESSNSNSAQVASVHAASITGLSEINPAEFRLTCELSINIFYILIIYPEEAK